MRRCCTIACLVALLYAAYVAGHARGFDAGYDDAHALYADARARGEAALDRIDAALDAAGDPDAATFLERRVADLHASARGTLGEIDADLTRGLVDLPKLRERVGRVRNLIADAPTVDDDRRSTLRVVIGALTGDAPRDPRAATLGPVRPAGDTRLAADGPNPGA